MLDAVPELPQDDIRDVERILGHEIHADALGTNKSPITLGLNNSRGKRIYFYVE